MRKREKGYPIYQFAPGEEKEMAALCQGKDPVTMNLLLTACLKANTEIAALLFCSLHLGLSYDKLAYIMQIPINRNDFYAYRRAALAEFRNKMKP